MPMFLTRVLLTRPNCCIRNIKLFKVCIAYNKSHFILINCICILNTTLGKYSIAIIVNSLLMRLLCEPEKAVFYHLMDLTFHNT